jgi:hypothetical protein
MNYKRLPSHMTHAFSRVPTVEQPRSKFPVAHTHKTTFDSGYLIPILADYALPGDTWDLNMSFVARLLTLAFPMMDNIYLESMVFGIPWRLVWDHSKQFFGEQKNPDDSTDFVIPRVNITSGHAIAGSFFHYAGLCRPGVALTGDNAPIAFIPRAFNLTYNEWFRDQNLQDSIPVPTDDGPDDPDTDGYLLRRRGKRHDYFTSCLPFPQKGPAVELPLGSSAPVVSGNNSQYPGTSVLGASFTPLKVDGTVYGPSGRIYGVTPSGLMSPVGWSNGNNAPPLNTVGYAVTASDGWYADLSSASSVTINSLRQAIQLQRYFERNARGGTRYIEWVHNHFGVVSPDARQQRPEYLGGGHTPIMISQVSQTSNDANQNVGDLGAFSLTNGQHRFVKSFTEHMVILWLVNVRADLTYQQGVNRKHFMRTVFDTPIPVFAHLGEQEVLQREIFITNVTADNNKVFGYQERYAEWRYMPSRVSGLFSSDASQPLDMWHLADDYAAAPVLSDAWIQDDPPIERVVRVQNQPQWKFDSFFHGSITRRLPVYSVPGLMDHF